MKVAGGKSIPPTGKRFHVEFCTVATGNEDGEITEERLFYDLVSFMKQIGLIYSDHPRRVPSLPSVHVLGGDLK